jgi:two-component system, cell cycle response regulator
MVEIRPSRWVRWAFALLGAWLVAFELHVVAGGAVGGVWFGRYVHDGVLLIAASLCAIRVIRCRQERLAWGLIAAALFSWTLGEVYYTIVVWDLKVIPVPSPADIGYLGMYPLAFAGLGLLLRSRVKGAAATLWVDGIIAAFAVAALSAAVIFEEVLTTIGGRPILVATNLAYPLGDLVLLGFVVAAVSLRRWRLDRTWTLIGAGIVTFWVADSLYLVQTAQNTYTQGGPFDIGWWAGIVFLAVAAWHSPPPSPSVEQRESTGSIVAPIGFALFGLGLLVVATLHHLNPLAIALATASLLGVIVRLIITFRENVTMLRTSRTEALTDALTGLGNRRQMMRDLDRRCTGAPELGPVHLLLFDLDGFKLYNDRFGHPAGDALLARLGHNLLRTISPFGTIHRLGGDEFCALVQPGDTRLEIVVATARTALSEQGEGFTVTTSCGMVAIPAEATSTSEALRIADARLYRDKDQRRPSPRRRTRNALLQLLHERNPDLHEHVSEVAGLARATGQRLGLPADTLDAIVRAAELHDLGKMAIPDSIVNKPAPLSVQEWEFMLRHTVIGERILAAADARSQVAGMVRSSHERFDGAGYPDGLSGHDIPLGSRIIFACDSLHAMTSDRPYQRARTLDDALAELHRCSGTQFDPDIVRALCEVIAEERRPPVDRGDPAGHLALAGHRAPGWVTSGVDPPPG